MVSTVRKGILTGIVLSQFMCTSVWFAVNAVMPQIRASFQLSDAYLTHLTSMVQFGFICGTLLFAVFTVADRFSPAKVFFACSLAAAFFNLGSLWTGMGSGGLLTARFGVGFFLAGIYPVGMKIASDFYQEGLGRSLGYLVGALVLGTAFPHFLSSFSGDLSWQWVVYGTSFLSVAGGCIMLWAVGDGPYRTKSKGVQLNAFFVVFKKLSFRKAAFGYFGHMWELYTFWAWVPQLLWVFSQGHSSEWSSSSLLAFAIIAIGFPACIGSGLLSKKFTARKVAALSLIISGSCCFLYPWVVTNSPTWLFVVFMLLWGLAVIADSPLFSTLVAQNAEPRYKGTALTIVNSTGFALTIISIQLLSAAWEVMGIYTTVLLGIGPVLGLLAIRK